jgi:hypothetical protein
MQAFKFRFDKLHRLLQQQQRWHEQRLQAIVQAQGQLVDQLSEIRRAIDQLAAPECMLNAATWHLIEQASSGHRDKILKVYQTTQAQIAELEKEKQVVRSTLQPLRQRNEQFLQLKQQDWNAWKARRSHQWALTEMEAILRESGDPASRSVSAES